MSDQSLLEQRYGSPSRAGRGILVGAAALVAVAFLAWLAWTALSHAEPEVSSALVTYDVVDEHTATARVDVRIDEAVVASCLLRAYAEDHTVVGERSFEATASSGTSYDQEIRTERRATSVELVGCTTPDQSRPR